MNFPEDDGTDEGGIVRCECGRAVPCRHCPTPIDPADIRAGDVVFVGPQLTVQSINRHGQILTSGGYYHVEDDFTWHLVSRPDPDAEAAKALDIAAGCSPYTQPGRALLSVLREQGWDVVRRAES